MREPALDQLIAFAASAMRRKLAFTALIAAFILACVWYSTGLSVISVVITIITVFILGLFALLVWFWTTVFAGVGGKRPIVIDGTATDVTPRDMKELNPPGAKR
jgi:hypothetical protein